jgi:hypothetical protein
LNPQYKHTISKVIDNVGEKTDKKLRAKIFLLDHTAEVLENFRRLQEYNIWKEELHYEREKLVALKKESLDLKNITQDRIGDYRLEAPKEAVRDFEAVYGNRKYLDDTESRGDYTEGYYSHQMIDFVPSMRILDEEMQRMEKQTPGVTDKFENWKEIKEEKAKMQKLFPHKEEDRQKFEEFKNSLSAEPTPYNQYLDKVTELKNLRIKSFLKDRTHNKELQKYLEAKKEDSERILIENENQDELMEIGI